MDFLHTPASTDQDRNARLLLAPGSMGAMDNPTLEHLSQALSANGVSVSRFEFAYMAQRRSSGNRQPPPRAEKLLDEYREAVSAAREALPAGQRLLIGGKSLGGRVASMIAEEQFGLGQVHGLACFGYPFHPPKKPDNLRTAHLAELMCPTIFVQGERDPFGTRTEVESYTLSPAIALHWAIDGDHDLKPRKASGSTHAQNLDDAAKAVAGLVDSLPI